MLKLELNYVSKGGSRTDKLTVNVFPNFGTGTVFASISVLLIQYYKASHY